MIIVTTKYFSDNKIEFSFTSAVVFILLTQMVPKIFAFLLFLIFLQCQEAKKLQVINGRKTDVKDLPYQLAFLHLGNFFCGASLISENFAITAGKKTGQIVCAEK